MAPVGDVSFELERFEWTADDTLEVVGRWNGVRPGRRLTRPALTIDSGGRRTRVSGTASVEGDDWHAVFEWDGSRGDVAGAELELGRSLVVELPPPRRRRRRRGATAEVDLRIQLDDLRATVTELTAERDRLRDVPPGGGEVAQLRAELRSRDEELARLRTELEALRAQAPAAEELETLRDDAASARGEAERLREQLLQAQSRADETARVVDELAGLRLAHGSLKAAHERLEDELDELRGVRDERDEAVGQLHALRSSAGDEEQQRAALGDVIRELQERTSAAEAARERLESELAVAREDVTRLQSLLAAREESLAAAEAESTRRLETERIATTEVHERLASAREEAQQSMAVEAAETERLRAELERTREDAEKLLAAERTEVARLREELLNSEVDVDADSKRMVERMERDLERERQTTRTLRRELEALRSQTAEHRRGNGALPTEEAPAPLTPAARAARSPVGTQRRVDAARVNAAARVPRVPPSRTSLWVVRVVATLLIAVMAIAIVVILQAIA